MPLEDELIRHLKSRKDQLINKDSGRLGEHCWINTVLAHAEKYRKERHPPISCEWCKKQKPLEEDDNFQCRFLTGGISCAEKMELRLRKLNFCPYCGERL